MNNKEIVNKSDWSNDKLEFFPTLNDVLVIKAQLSSARRSNTFSTWSIWVIITGSNQLPNQLPNPALHIVDSLEIVFFSQPEMIYPEEKSIFKCLLR